MATRTRPESCCDVALPPIPLSDRQKEEWSRAFRALSEPTRLEIVLLLAAQRAPLCACDVGDRFSQSQPTISHHMKVLIDSGLVDADRQGVWAYYQLSDQGRGVVEGIFDLEDAVVMAH